MSEKIEGKNPVLEALKAERDFDRILIAREAKNLQEIIDIAKTRGIPIRFAERKLVSQNAETSSNQGIIAYMAVHNYANVGDILKIAKDKNEPPFIIILDEICDPHNLGAIIRTANAAGAHGVIIPKRNSASLNATVAKTSAGAIEYTPVARVSNISKTIDKLKEEDIWIYGTLLSDTAKDYYSEDLTGALALVIGNEGSGIGSLVGKKCDFHIKIPMLGEISSLNASVAAGIVMYEVLKQRKNL